MTKGKNMSKMVWGRASGFPDAVAQNAMRRGYGLFCDLGAPASWDDAGRPEIFGKWHTIEGRLWMDAALHTPAPVTNPAFNKVFGTGATEFSDEDKFSGLAHNVAAKFASNVIGQIKSTAGSIDHLANYFGNTGRADLWAGYLTEFHQYPDDGGDLGGTEFHGGGHVVGTVGEVMQFLAAEEAKSLAAEQDRRDSQMRDFHEEGCRFFMVNASRAARDVLRRCKRFGINLEEYS